MTGKEPIAMLMVLSLFLLGAAPKEYISHPLDAVRKFDACYGRECLPELTEMVTDNFMDYKPAALWVFDALIFLAEMKYQRITFDILSVRIEGDEAEIAALAEIDTVYGRATQTETYRLVFREKEWLIDERTISDQFYW